METLTKEFSNQKTFSLLKELEELSLLRIVHNKKKLISSFKYLKINNLWNLLFLLTSV